MWTAGGIMRILKIFNNTVYEKNTQMRIPVQNILYAFSLNQ